ncbi:GSCFA domain-containing protein [Zavarzinia aquatilis]|uniref:GSCFA domain-containing protein n=1 Tax=Zavarzinia aquatilis TaxID=2211142 RepID=A0A317E6V1_9PROT|nr:GSCFA domain-containing protein [Zavarzinia aquatilis]PWR22838.1 hypothetical protein DKG74_10465 [Zavarzinia aquatilis]
MSAIDDSKADEGELQDSEDQIDKPAKKKNRSFFRGETATFHPNRIDLEQPDAVWNCFLLGITPTDPPVAPGQGLIVLGDGIAAPITAGATGAGLKSLTPNGPEARECGIPERLRRLLDKAIGDKRAKSGKAADLRAALSGADLIVLCLTDRSAERPSHAEIVEDIVESCRLLRKARPDAYIALALSPCPPPRVPAGQPQAAALFSAKSALRSAIDETCRKLAPLDGRLGYFPAFEIVGNICNYPYGADRRSLADHARSLIEAAFACAYVAGVGTEALAAAHVAARAADIVAGNEMRAVAEAAAGQTPPAIDTAAWPGEAEMVWDRGLHRFAFDGLMPARPVIGADTTIIAFGSCFASNISRYLNSIGYNVATRRDGVAYISRMGDGIVNTYAIRQQFEWAWENRKPQIPLWHDYDAEEFGYDENVRLRTKELFDAGDVFIITIGLSEVWYDDVTGEVFWRAVPAERFDPSRHKFRIVEQAESLANLEAIHALIRKYRPDAKIVLTLSPIPLMATFRPGSCIVASAASKAILRSALDEFFARHRGQDDGMFYFPAYEVILGAFHQPFGLGETSDMRHPMLHAILFNMKVFERYFCDTQLKDEDIADEMDEMRYRDFALVGPDREAVISVISTEKVEWRTKYKGPTIEGVARRKNRRIGPDGTMGEDPAIVARRKQEAKAEREAAVAQRKDEASAKRLAAVAEREAASEARRREADQRRQEAAALRAARVRPPR